MALDPRIVTIGIEVNGQIKTFNGLSIIATGTKYGNENQDECEIKLGNVDSETQNFILSETSPFNSNNTPKRVFLDAGRVSYGTTRIFTGEVVRANPSQPPDIFITLKCLSNNFQKGNIVARSQPANAQLSSISQNIANDLGVSLDFQAVEKTINNYNFTGSALKQVDLLAKLANINAFIDNDILIVKNINTIRNNAIKLVSAQTGMIGVPEVTEEGIKVKFFVDNQTVLGGAIQVDSKVYPTLNGTYIIYKLSFEITSRDVPFYYIAEAKRQ